MFKALALQILAILIFSVLIVVFWKTDNVSKNKETFRQYNENWSVELDGNTVEYEVLPDKLDSLGTGQITLRRRLGDSLENMGSIAFFTSHQLIDVYVNEQQVYQVRPQRMMTSKTPGNLWNFVELEEGYEEGELKIVLTNCYGKGTISIPDFYCGAKDSIELWYIEKQFLPFLISMLIFLIGLALVVVYFTIRKTMAVNESILWLGMFAIPLGVWSGLECQFWTFFTGHTLLLSQLTFMVVKLTVIPILQFVRMIYEVREDKIIWSLCTISKLDFWVTGALQLLGWMDYKQTLWVSHLIFIASAIYVLVLTIQILLEKGERSRRSRQTIVVHTICVGIVSVCVLLDVFSFYFLSVTDSSKFCRMGVMIYTIVLATQLLNNSVRLIRAGKQVDKFRMEAETDDMTKLKNRRSFEKALHKIENHSMEGYGIVLCDLNNLKRFNDKYGHSVGDYYIIISSEMIQDVYGQYGTVYRIGGDEFCAIVRGIDEIQVERLCHEMCQKLQELSGNRFKETMSVAVGYAGFDMEKDRNLSDTMARADAAMYQHKRIMKEMKENLGK